MSKKIKSAPKPKPEKKPVAQAATPARAVRPLKERMANVPAQAGKRITALVAYLSRLSSPQASSARESARTVQATLEDLRTAVAAIPATDQPQSRRSLRQGDRVRINEKMQIARPGALAAYEDEVVKGLWSVGKKADKKKNLEKITTLVTLRSVVDGRQQHHQSLRSLVFVSAGSTADCLADANYDGADDEHDGDDDDEMGASS